MKHAKKPARAVTVQFTIKLNPPDQLVQANLAREIEEATKHIVRAIQLATDFMKGLKP